MPLRGTGGFSQGRVVRRLELPGLCRRREMPLSIPRGELAVIIETNVGRILLAEWRSGSRRCRGPLQIVE